ncbi:MAG: hypothetical protein K8T26_08985 [Lentisphaerae bacterium]|nr:hypothetical protein [Lentisphaerota bacterium]
MSDTPDDTLAKFEKEIARQEELLYGIALFFEGISLLFAGQDAVLETYRKQFRNIIQTGSAATERARTLLDEARLDARKIAMVEQFVFRPGDGHPEPERLAARAQLLVETYTELFPKRPRDQALTPEETLRLVETASVKPGYDA